jgi:hypothetical protein
MDTEEFHISCPSITVFIVLLSVPEPSVGNSRAHKQTEQLILFSHWLAGLAARNKRGLFSDSVGGVACNLCHDYSWYILFLYPKYCSM